MKKIIVLFISIAFLSLSLHANPNDMWDEANKLYSEKNYVQAADIYRQLIEEGQSADLFYNYANACYKMGDLGKSILYYERALALQPNFEDAKSNLAFVNSHITDKIEPMERFFISEWIYLLGKQLTSNQWAFLSIITFSLALILLLTYMFARLRWIRKVAFFAGIFSILLAFASASYSFYIHNNQLHHPEAIVMVGSAPIKSAPDQSGTELFVLHEGTKVTIKSRLGTWVEIRIADGNVGWMPESQITVI